MWTVLFYSENCAEIVENSSLWNSLKISRMDQPKIQKVFPFRFLRCIFQVHFVCFASQLKVSLNLRTFPLHINIYTSGHNKDDNIINAETSSWAHTAGTRRFRFWLRLLFCYVSFYSSLCSPVLRKRIPICSPCYNVFLIFRGSHLTIYIVDSRAGSPLTICWLGLSIFSWTNPPKVLFLSPGSGVSWGLI